MSLFPLSQVKYECLFLSIFASIEFCLKKYIYANLIDKDWYLVLIVFLFIVDELDYLRNGFGLLYFFVTLPIFLLGTSSGALTGPTFSMSRIGSTARSGGAGEALSSSVPLPGRCPVYVILPLEIHLFSLFSVYIYLKISGKFPPRFW